MHYSIEIFYVVSLIFIKGNEWLVQDYVETVHIIQNNKEQNTDIISHFFLTNNMYVFFSSENDN